jgi:hypothetical protein
MHIFRSISEPIRLALDWDTLWGSEDEGLIACWERGREKRLADPTLTDPTLADPTPADATLAAKVTAGHLPLLPWKGGFKAPTKLGWRYGTFNYLAMWQGLRGEDLNLDTARDITIVCAATGMRAVFTADTLKFAPSGDDEQEEE